MPRVLIVDDDPLIRRVQRLCLETAGHEVEEAEDGFVAVGHLRHDGRFDVMVADYAMPRGNGLELVRAALHIDPGLACIMCTSFYDVAIAAEAMAAGAVGFIAKPFKPDDLRRAVDSAAERRRTVAEAMRLRLITPVLERFTAVLANTIEARDASVQRHCERLVELADELAARLQIGGNERATVRLGACLHDVGKVAIPDRILQKPDRLTDDEWDVIRTHSEIGATLLADIDMWVGVGSIVRHHHERFDGRGYPDGLAGAAIPMGARIVAVVDAFDVMRSGRSYRAARTVDEALGELRRLRGAQFDPDCVTAFIDLIAGGGMDEGGSMARRERPLMLSGVGADRRLTPLAS